MTPVSLPLGDRTVPLNRRHFLRIIQTLGLGSSQRPCKVLNVELLGTGQKLKFTQSADAPAIADTYISLGDLAESKGLKTFSNQRGLLLISRKPIAYNANDPVLDDCVVTLFDTPEMLADPSVLIHYVPVPHSQGEWYEHASATPEQMKQLAQPEVHFSLTPKSAYDSASVDTTVFGSKVPPPGVWPRVLFSPDDVPALAARVKASKFGQMSMIEIEEQFKHSFWDPSTADGRLFKKLSTGDIADLKFDRGNAAAPFTPYASGNLFAGFKPVLYNSHISYVTNALVTMSLYALLTDNAELGKQCAASVSNFYNPVR